MAITIPTAYTKQTYDDGQTLFASSLNQSEDGIYTNSQNIITIVETVNTLDNTVSSLSDAVNLVSDKFNTYTDQEHNGNIVITQGET